MIYFFATVENIKLSKTSELNELINKFSPYLAEIKKRIIVTAFVFVGATIFGFVFYEKIVKLLIDVLSLRGVNIVFTSPFQFINLSISCGIATGVVFVIPLLIYQILSFLRPALKHREYKMILKTVPFSIILFLSGSTFGILMMKWQIKLFLEKSIELGIGNILDVSHLMSTVILVAVFMGVVFQFPIIMLLLISVGIITTEFLRKQRMWVYLTSMLLIILLPIDSILTDFLLALPLIILFEITLLFNSIFYRRTFSKK